MWPSVGREIDDVVSVRSGVTFGGDVTRKATMTMKGMWNKASN